MAEKICKDCIAELGIQLSGSPRPAPYPGPRCATHWRAVKKARAKRSHGRRVEKVYSITEERYWELFELQGGKCAMCRRGKGKSKRLAVDHDHSCCAGPTSCGKCVRGLVCGRCNDVLAHARDQVSYFWYAWLYIQFPPAQKTMLWVDAIDNMEA